MHLSTCDLLEAEYQCAWVDTTVFSDWSIDISLASLQELQI